MSNTLHVSADQATTSPINHLDPRTRLLATILATITMVSIDNILMLTGFLMFAAIMTIIAGLGAAAVLRRLMLLEGFVIVLLVILPFTTAGEPLIEMGPVSPSVEGLTFALVIAIKTNGIALLNLALIGTLSPQRVGYALLQLGIPGNLVQLLLTSVRYISVLENEYFRIRRAMKARAFVARSNVHTWRTFGWLVGMLLVRSYERSCRVNNAMKCRGFDGSFNFHSESNWANLDIITLASATAVSAGLITWSHLI